MIFVLLAINIIQAYSQLRDRVSWNLINYNYISIKMDQDVKFKNHFHDILPYPKMKLGRVKGIFDKYYEP